MSSCLIKLSVKTTWETRKEINHCMRGTATIACYLYRPQRCSTFSAPPFSLCAPFPRNASPLAIESC